MSDTPPHQPHAPRLLIASHHAEAGLALKELGEKNGYTVLRCFTATQTLERARTTRPDVIALDDSLLDADPLETSRALRDDPLVGASTPILLVTGQAATPEHHRALRAGVWEFLPYPFNVDEAAARLHTYVLFKFESERARGTEAVQDDAGLYTTRGLALRAQALTLQAFHHGAALSCVALASTPTSDGTAPPASSCLREYCGRAAGAPTRSAASGQASSRWWRPAPTAWARSCWHSASRAPCARPPATRRHRCARGTTPSATPATLLSSRSTCSPAPPARCVSPKATRRGSGSGRSTGSEALHKSRGVGGGGVARVTREGARAAHLRQSRGDTGAAVPAVRPRVSAC